MARLRPLLWALAAVCVSAMWDSAGVAARWADARRETQNPPPAQSQRPPAKPPTGAANPAPDQAVGDTTPQLPPRPPIGKLEGTLRGRVTASDHTPLNRVRVTVAADEIYDPGTHALYHRLALTDADGHFSIDKLPAGKTFVITAGKSGFSPRSFGETVSGEAPPPVTLAESEVREGIDIQLAPEATIAGRVRDTRGNPNAGLLVEVLRSRTSAAPDVVGDAVTDDLGAFTVAALPAGQYSLRATDPAFASADPAVPPLVPPTFYPSTTNQHDAKMLTVAAGAHLDGIDVILQLPAVSAPAEATGGTISGRVTDLMSDTPIGDARVILTAPELGQQPHATLTDKDGKYTFAGLPASTTFVVTVAKAGYAPRAYGELPPVTLPSAISLAAGARRDDVDVKMVQQIPVTGVVSDADGSPMGGVVIEALRATYAEGRRDLTIVADAISDSAGEYRLIGLPPGQYYVSGFDPAFAEVGDAEGSLFYGNTYFPGFAFPDDATRIVLDPGIDRDGADFKLQLIKPARVRGTTTTSDGRGLVAGDLIMSALRSDNSASYSVANVTMAANGSFVFANVLPGRYQIWARGLVDTKGTSYFTTFTLPVQGEDVSNIPIVLSPGSIADGTITWKTNGAHQPPMGVAAEAIRIRAPMESGATYGDALTGKLVTPENSFSILGLMPGRHLFRVENLPDPWQLTSVTWNNVDVTDTPFDTTNYDVLHLQITVSDESTQISGTVDATRKDVLPSCNVVAFTPNPAFQRINSRQVQLAHVNQDGRYRLRGLPIGKYYLLATRDLDEGDLGNQRLLEKFVRTAQIVELATPTSSKVIPLYCGR